MAKKINNFKEMKGEELKKELATLRESLRVLHFKTEGSKSKNVKESLALRKKIAQALTEINSSLHQVKGISPSPGVGAK